jgi:hypothetical protein
MTTDDHPQCTVWMAIGAGSGRRQQPTLNDGKRGPIIRSYQAAVTTLYPPRCWPSCTQRSRGTAGSHFTSILQVQNPWVDGGSIAARRSALVACLVATAGTPRSTRSPRALRQRRVSERAVTPKHRPTLANTFPLLRTPIWYWMTLPYRVCKAGVRGSIPLSST